MGKHKYLLQFVDEFTSYRWGFLLKSRELPYIKQFYQQINAFIKNHTGTHIHFFRADNEFNKTSFIDYIKGNGTIPEFTNPYSSFQNGRVERGFLTIFNFVRASLAQCKLSKHLWGYAALHGISSMNNCIINNHGKVPHEHVFNTVPDLKLIQPFGTICYRHYPKETRQDGKLSDRGGAAFYLGQSQYQKGFYVLDYTSKKISSCRAIRYPSIRC
jgi:hypothetical protein